MRDAPNARILLRRANNFIFGYDFFIAHSWHEDRQGHAYAERLVATLEPNLRCFLDSKDFPKGAHWTIEGRRALSHTSVLIVVATPPVFHSAAVLDEVCFFVAKKPRNRIIVIDVEGAFSKPAVPDHPLIQAIGVTRLRISEGKPLAEGPSQETCEALRADFNLTTENTKRFRILGWTAAVLAALAIGAGIASWIAIASAGEARSRALAAESLALTQAEPTRVADALRFAIASLQLDRSPGSIYAARSVLSFWPRALRCVQTADQTKPVGGAASADGSRYAFCEASKFVLYDANTGKTLATQLSAGYDVWSDVKFSSDSRWVAVTQFKRAKVELFRADNGVKIQEFDHKSPWKLSWNPRDSTLAVSGPAEVVLCSFDATGVVRTRRALANSEYAEGHSAEITDAAFSADGTILAIGCTIKETKESRPVATHGVVHCVKWPELAKLASMSFATRPTAVAVDQSGSRVAVIDDSEVITVWDLVRKHVLWSSGSLGANLGTPTTAAIRSSLSFSADGSRIVSRTLAPGLRVWDSSNGRETCRIPSRAQIQNLQWLDADRIRFTNGNGELWESSVCSGDAEKLIRSNLEAPARDFLCLRDAFCFSMEDGFGILRVAAESSPALSKVQSADRRFVFDSRSRSLAFQTDASTITVETYYSPSQTIPLVSGRFVPENLRRFSLSPCASYLAVAGEIGLFQVYETASRRKIWELPQQSPDPATVESLLWDSSGRAVAAGTLLYDLDTGRVSPLNVPPELRAFAATRRFASVFCLGPGFVGKYNRSSEGSLSEKGRVALPRGNHQIIVSPCGRFACVFAHDVTGRGGRILDLSAMRVICLVNEGTRILHSSYSDDESRIAVLGQNGQCLVYSTADGKLLDRWRASIDAQWVGWTRDAKVAIADASGTVEIRSLDANAVLEECQKRRDMFETETSTR
jgi:WD40 repeat protein